MNEVNKQNEFNEKEEIDAYFRDVKKKGFPTKLFFIFLLLLIIGGCAYYYFVIDSPKNIFLTKLNDKFSGIKIDYTNYNTVNYDYSLDMNMVTNNKEYIEVSNILNQIAITGELGIDTNEKKTFIKLNTFYEQKDLLSFATYYENDSVYIKLNNLFDKVIKTELEESDKEEIKNSYNTTDMDTLKKTINSLTNIIVDTLKNANYKKEYTNLNDTIVKKITLVIDKKFMEDLYNRLLNDKDFIDAYSELEEISSEELKENINNEINNLEEFTVTISLYVSILENEFIMLEIIEEDDKIILTKEKDEYNYKIYNDSIIAYQGYISVEEEENEYEIYISIEDIEEELNIELNLDLSYEYNQDINTLDTKNTVEYESLTETDMNKITENLMNNDAFLNLMEDISLSFSTGTTQETYYGTT